MDVQNHLDRTSILHPQHKGSASQQEADAELVEACVETIIEAEAGVLTYVPGLWSVRINWEPPIPLYLFSTLPRARIARPRPAGRRPKYGRVALPREASAEQS